MRRNDLLWMLAYPLYQVMGTLRHEASHAFSAVLQGGEVEKFVILPSWDASRGLLWGYVRLSENGSWLTLAAPYLADLLTFSLGLVVCTAIPMRRRWLWVNLYILLMLSPLINTLYNYRFGLSQTNDVGRLMHILPPPVVHTFFLLALLYYIAAGVYAWKFAPPG